MSGVCVEVELSRVKGKGIEGEDFLVDVEEAIQFVREKEVDSLAVGIGTAHGFYTGGQPFPMRILEKLSLWE